jgi:predicted nucleic acid-binding protein
MARFPAFLDTCSVFPAYLCDTLLRLAEAEAYRPLWSPGVLEELQRNLVEERGLSSEAVAHRISEMRRSFPDAEVTGYDDLVSAMTCDQKDRHVLAAAIRGGAEVLVQCRLLKAGCAVRDGSLAESVATGEGLSRRCAVPLFPLASPAPAVHPRSPVNALPGRWM